MYHSYFCFLLTARPCNLIQSRALNSDLSLIFTYQIQNLCRLSHSNLDFKICQKQEILIFDYYSDIL